MTRLNPLDRISEKKEKKDQEVISFRNRCHFAVCLSIYRPEMISKLWVTSRRESGVNDLQLLNYL